MRIPAAIVLLTALAAALPAAAANNPDSERRAKALFQPHEIFADELFGPATEPIDPSRVFAINEEMRTYLRESVVTGSRLKGPRQALFDSLYRTDGLALDY